MKMVLHEKKQLVQLNSINHECFCWGNIACHYAGVLYVDFLIFTSSVKKMWIKDQKLITVLLLHQGHSQVKLTVFLKMQMSEWHWRIQGFLVLLLPWFKLRHLPFYPPLPLHRECKCQHTCSKDKLWDSKKLFNMLTVSVLVFIVRHSHTKKFFS